MELPEDRQKRLDMFLLDNFVEYYTHDQPDQFVSTLDYQHIDRNKILEAFNIKGYRVVSITISSGASIYALFERKSGF